MRRMGNAARFVIWQRPRRRASRFWVVTLFSALSSFVRSAHATLAVFVGPAALSTLVGACAVGPNYVSPPPPDVRRYTPDETANIGGVALTPSEEVPQLWWAAFHDQNLNKLIAVAIARNPGLQAAEAATRVAFYTAEAQKGVLLPSIGGQSNNSLNYQSPVTFGVTPNGPTNPYTFYWQQLSVSYTVDVWGGNRRTIESLEAQTDQQRYQLEAAYLALTSNIASGAINEAMTRGEAEAIRSVIEEGQDLLAILRKQYKIGAVAEADVLAQEALLAQDEQLLPPLEKQLGIQRDQLVALAGQYSTTAVPETFHLRTLRLPKDIPLTVPSRFVRQRPDVRAAEANLHSASAQIGVAIAARLPNITLSATPGVQAYTWAGLFTPEAPFYTLAADATQPLFDGFSLANKQKAAEEGLKQADALYRQSLITAFQNVADALHSLRADTNAVTASAHAEQVAREQLDIVKKQLSVGSVNVLAVLNAEQVYLQALVTHIQAEGARLGDVVGLFMALGGGWKDENLKNLPPDGPQTPAAEEISKIETPVNPGWLPTIPKLTFTPF
jgi:NodT family efflux transporter outer membrane factor (OMF) lipoprotein